MSIAVDVVERFGDIAHLDFAVDDPDCEDCEQRPATHRVRVHRDCVVVLMCWPCLDEAIAELREQLRRSRVVRCRCCREIVDRLDDALRWEPL